MSQQPELQPNHQLPRRARARFVFTLEGQTASVRQVLRLLTFGALMLAVSVSMVVINLGTPDVQLTAGEIATETIKSPRTETFVSAIRTAELRQEAYADQRNIVETYDETVRDDQIAELQAFLAEAQEIRNDTSQTAPVRAEGLRTLLEDLTEEDAQGIVGLSQASWAKVNSEALRLVDETLSRQLRADAVAGVKEDLAQRASPSITRAEQDAAVAIARPFVRANVFVDEAATLAKRQAAASDVEPVQVTVQQGQAIVRDGDPVTELDIEKLGQLGLLTDESNGESRAGKAGLLTILTIVLVAYLYVSSRKIWQGRQLLLVALVIIGPIVGARLALPSDDIQYMFPAAASAMLLAILLNFQFAAVVSALLAMYLGVIADMSFELAFVYFVGSVIGGFLIWQAERTVTFVWAGIGVALSSFAVAICFEAIAGDLSSSDIAPLAVQTLMNGALSASVTFLSFSLLGSIFGITTHLQLLELAHPNQSLLYRLAREAPGTYHHSIVVSNLAETGVELVGGDPLFARVAVLYHDIGKIVRPTFFIENQANRENPHDMLDPSTSAGVIIDHVLDGVRLARKARLPRPLIDIIEQHHGTTLIRFFYCKALESDPDTAEAAFRYPGPRPQTKEAGVIMLADGVEAAVRAGVQSGTLSDNGNGVKDPSDAIDRVVRRVFQERLDDGQLDECDLTMRDLDSIRRAFVQILEGIYHPRIEYPGVRTPARQESEAVTADSPA